jgi:hypothetical protein
VKPLCRHCQKVRSNRPRGLCWTCYYTPGLKDLYPSTSKYARRSDIPDVGDGRPPAEPTIAPPGSQKKMAAMQRRAERGETLFHPRDERVPVAALLTPFPSTWEWTPADTGLEPDAA